MTLKIMRRKRTEGDILTTSDIRRIQAEIAADTKARDAASERISANKMRLDRHDLAAASARARAMTKPARKGRRAGRPTAVEVPQPTAIQPSSQKHERGGGSYSVVMDILQRAREGLPAPELRRKASEHPEASDSLKKHPSYIYSILEQLKGRAEVEKGKDGKWRAINAAAGATTH